MHWKPLLVLVIVIGITGFLLFSERGIDFKENYLSRSIKTIGDFARGISGKFSQVTSVNRTLEFRLTTFQSDFKNLNLQIQEKSFSGILKYDSVLIGNQNIKVRDNDEVNFNIEKMEGEIKIDENGKMLVKGSSSFIELNDIVFGSEVEQKKVKFELLGTPVSYTLTDIENSEISLSQVSGLLRVATWQPLKLENNGLDVISFKGDITLEDNSVIISGMAKNAYLDDVPLGLK
jgi:hypothetical protein